MYCKKSGEMSRKELAKVFSTTNKRVQLLFKSFRSENNFLEALWRLLTSTFSPMVHGIEYISIHEMLCFDLMF